jgi:hypothetical protein
MVKIESKRKWRSPISRKIATELQAIQFWMQVTSQTQIASQKPAISCQLLNSQIFKDSKTTG